VIGTDLYKLEGLGDEIFNAIKGIKGVEDAGVFRLLGQPNLIITPDRLACGRYGVQIADVNNAIGCAIGGTALTQVLQGDRRFDVVARFDRTSRDTPAAIGRIPIQTADGAMVPLSNMASIELATGAGFIFREDNVRYIPIKFSVRGRDLTSTIADIQSAIKSKIKFPDGYYYQISGQFEQLSEAIGRLNVIIPVTLALMLLILSRSFGSLKDACIVMFSIPMAGMGGIWALWFRGIRMSISAGVGFISLAGVCTLEGVLFVSRIKRGIVEGMTLKESVVRAGELRLRPVLMVELGAAIGLTPAALATGIGSETQRPLATVVVGGMLTSLPMILIVLPCLYALLNTKRFPDPVE
jgi:cobalt-zinc-cadmium resistance protein CzcA